jgi:hypothetical protein
MRDGALALGAPFRSREVAPGRLAGLLYSVESPTRTDCYLQPVDKDAAGSAMRMSILSEPAFCGVLLSELMIDHGVGVTLETTYEIRANEAHGGRCRVFNNSVNDRDCLP